MSEMNRRSFLAGLGALVGGIALEQAIPFGRVWSFPKEIKLHQPNCLLTHQQITEECLRILERNLRFKTIVREYDGTFAKGAKIGHV